MWDKQGTLTSVLYLPLRKLLYLTQVPVSLRNMIGRSFATEEAQDQIRAAVLNLFQVEYLDLNVNTNKVRTLQNVAERDNDKNRTIQWYESNTLGLIC